MVASKKIILCGIVFLAATTCWAVDWLALGGSFGTAAVVNKDESFRAATDDLSRVVLVSAADRYPAGLRDPGRKAGI